MLQSQICSNQVRQYVLKFLKKTQKEHDEKVNQLKQRIKQLQELKNKVEVQLQKSKQQLRSKQLKIKKLEQQLQVLHEESTQNTSAISAKDYLKYENSSDQFIRHLRQVPIQILRHSKTIEASPLKLDQKNQEAGRGQLQCVVWSRDKESIERYQNISRQYVSSLIKKYNNKIQYMMIYNQK